MTIRIDITKEEIEALAALVPWRTERQGIPVDEMVSAFNQAISKRLEESGSESKWI